MRVAFLLSEFPRLTQTFVLSALDGLLQRGHDVTVYAARPDEADLDADTLDRLSARVRLQPRLADERLPRTASGLSLVARHGWKHPTTVARAIDPFRLGRYAMSFATLHATVPLFDKPTFDIVHCHFGPAGVFGAMLHEMGAIRGPLVVTFYGHDVTRYPLERGAGVYDKLFERASLVLALDPVMRERLIELGAPADRVEVHPLCIDCKDFVPADPPPAPPLRLLAVGRFVEKKGFDDAIRAVAAARRNGIDVRLRIAGDGPDKAGLRATAVVLGVDEHVEFLGNVDHADVPALMAEAHALIAPSVRARDGDEEGTPTVILEALACGLPVLATRHAGIPHIVTEGETGWLVDERDPEALAARMANLLDTPRVETVRDAARRSAESRFDTPLVAERLEEHYERLVSTNPMSPG